ncbi:hypothetical protein V144x_16530 [Gimesia aquarii]|uniref:Uncharacterized protein n=1 Tax=Gimesia aquarii TaxID=2527964 RepID=A0A517VT99_9PLAN|nr:hypothetical protein V144x_16530 [Gimesia aquarii]
MSIQHIKKIPARDAECAVSLLARWCQILNIHLIIRIKPLFSEFWFSHGDVNFKESTLLW